VDSPQEIVRLDPREEPHRDRLSSGGVDNDIHNQLGVLEELECELIGREDVRVVLRLQLIGEGAEGLQSLWGVVRHNRCSANNKETSRETERQRETEE
jgi:hypothetical protein